MVLNGEWREAPERFMTEVLPIIRRHSDRIITLFEEGDEDATRVVRSYSTLQRGFDPVSDSLMRDALKRMGMMP